MLVLASHLAGLIAVLPASNFGIVLRFFFIPGWSGVDLFFALSGFLITGILLDSKGAPNYFSSFYARRFLRIFPLYYATLAIIFVTAAAAPDLLRIRTLVPESRDWWTYFAYLQNWPLVQRGGSPRANIVGHFWSLAVEEQFYLVWPLCVWLLSRRVLFRLCCAGIAGALLFRCILVSLYGGETLVIHRTASRMDCLLIGSALAIAIREGWPITRRTIRLLAIAGGALVLLIAVFRPLELIETNTFMQTIGVTGFALLSASLIGTILSGGGRVFHLRPLRALGKYSYGIYVLHQPVFIFLVNGRPNLPPTNIGISLVYVSAVLSQHRLSRSQLRTL